MKAAAPTTAEHQADAEIDQRLGGPARVVGDAVLGVGRLLAGDVEMIEALVAEPARDQLLDHPGAPAHLQGLAREHDADADRGHGRDDQREHQDGAGEGVHVAGLQASKNQRFQWFMATVAPVDRMRKPASPSVSSPGAARRLAPPEAAGEPAEGADHAGVELEARRIRGLEVVSAHGGSQGRRVGKARRSGAPLPMWPKGLKAA